MKTPIYYVNAFTDKLFSGNPAAVCLLSAWPNNATLQKIALENALPVTAFVSQYNDEWEIRWFTPEYELPLCGHGTLAASYVIGRILGEPLSALTFQYASGKIDVTLDGQDITFAFPTKPVIACDIEKTLIDGLGLMPLEVYTHDKERLLVIVYDENQVRTLEPNIKRLAGLEQFGIIVSAKGVIADFVSRTFYPRKTMYQEDAVTGVSHCILAPYWAEKFSKNELFALQVSERNGYIRCKVDGNKVSLSSRAILYSKGVLFLNLRAITY